MPVAPAREAMCVPDLRSHSSKLAVGATRCVKPAYCGFDRLGLAVARPTNEHQDAGNVIRLRRKRYSPSLKAVQQVCLEHSLARSAAVDGPFSRIVCVTRERVGASSIGTLSTVSMYFTTPVCR